MNVIIIGCGKLGSGLAKLLVSKKHNVTIIDSDPASFELLGENFGGTTMVGSGFSRDILESAGIKTADAIISCSKNDDANALIGRLGQNIYHVPCVISRLYDPRKAKIYRSLGIRTISTTTWGVEPSSGRAHRPRADRSGRDRGRRHHERQPDFYTDIRNCPE